MLKRVPTWSEEASFFENTTSAQMRPPFSSGKHSQTPVRTSWSSENNLGTLGRHKVSHGLSDEALFRDPGTCA